MANNFVETQSTIIRVKHSSNFTQIHNEFLRDKQISWKAKGLLCTIMSLPDKWIVKKTTLHQFSSDGRDATIRAFNELKDAGYIIQAERFNRNRNGMFKGITYFISDKKLNTDNPITENPKSDNTEQINTEALNNVVSNNEVLNKAYPVLATSITDEQYDYLINTILQAKY